MPMSLTINLNWEPTLQQELFSLRRGIESAYRDLPWPKELKDITFGTVVAGGNGDISAAAKVINAILKRWPDLQITWILLSSREHPGASSFLETPSKVRIVKKLSGETHCLVIGPAKYTHSLKYFLSDLGEPQLKGPLFVFQEYGSIPELEKYEVEFARLSVRSLFEEPINVSYFDLHKSLFRTPESPAHGLPMGLRAGSGIFIDPTRRDASRLNWKERRAFLEKIEDSFLKKEILAIAPDARLGFGYAHEFFMRGRFLDCLVLSEKEKDVAAILNLKCAFSTEEENSVKGFGEQFLTEERVTFLKEKGFSKIVIKGDTEIEHSLSKKGRILTILLSPLFSPATMKHLQIACEFHLTTGDQSTGETFSAGCQFFLYENYAFCKSEFLSQMTKIATAIYPPLAEFIQIGANQKLKEMEVLLRLEELMQDPQLPAKTQEFCAYIADHFSFEPVLLGALNRAAWHYKRPDLLKIEADLLNVRNDLFEFFKAKNSPPKTIQVDLASFCKEIEKTITNLA